MSGVQTLEKKSYNHAHEATSANIYVNIVNSLNKGTYSTDWLHDRITNLPKTLNGVNII